MQVTRDELEQMSADLMERVAGPLERALASAKMSMEQVDHLIIVGAGTRMPKVQETLTKLTGRDLGKNLNADEAAALGAVYRAADLSTGFQVSCCARRNGSSPFTISLPSQNISQLQFHNESITC